MAFLNRVQLNRAQTHRTVDGQPIKIGAEVFCRVGNKDEITGLYRVRKMRVVEFGKGTNVRLTAADAKLAKSGRGATRLCSQLYAERNYASGRSIIFDNPLA